MADIINSAPAQSGVTQVGKNTQIATTVQKQTQNDFGTKLGRLAGDVGSFVAGGASTVAGAMGFRGGQVAAQQLQNVTSKLSSFGSTTGSAMTTQVHGMSNASVQASAPGAQSNQPLSFGAGAAASTGPGKIVGNQSGPAFGAGAIGLDGGSGLTGGGTGSTGSSMGSNSAIGSASGGDSQGALLNATKAMQETQMSFNLQYLQLQSQMQSENRSYTAVSNIMKTKHDTVKNSISNVR